MTTDQEIAYADALLRNVADEGLSDDDARRVLLRAYGRMDKYRQFRDEVIAAGKRALANVTGPVN